MASRRKLKKVVNRVLCVLFTECMVRGVHMQTDRTQLNKVVEEVLSVWKDYLTRISHPQPGTPPKAYYKKYAYDFDRQMKKLIDDIEALK